MTHIIKSFDGAPEECAFVEEYVSEHFDWLSLRKDLINARPFPHMILAVEAGRPIGVILMHMNMGYESEDSDAVRLSPPGPVWVCRLFVDEGHRNKGIGGNLVRASEQYARENNVSELWLDSIQAGAYYERKFSYQYVSAVPYKSQITKVYKKIFRSASV